MSKHPKAAPMIERLRSIPENLSFECPSHWSIGVTCHEAATRITQLEAQLAEAQAENERLLDQLDWLAISGETLVTSEVTGRVYVTGLNDTHHETPSEAIAEAMMVAGEEGEL